MTTWIVTHCKGYYRHLQETLDSFLVQDGIAGVLVVDYDCPEHCGDRVLARRDAKRVAVVKVQDRPLFSYNKSRNIGVRAAIDRLGADHVLLLDCDVVLPHAGCANLFGKPAGIGALANPDLAGGHLGQAMIEASAFHKLRGYDEGHTGYGHCETDFYARARAAGIPLELMSVPFSHLHSSDSERTAYLEIKEINDQVIHKNAIWASDRTKDMNPDGYGQYDGYFILKEPHHG